MRTHRMVHQRMNQQSDQVLNAKKPKMAGHLERLDDVAKALHCRNLSGDSSKIGKMAETHGAACVRRASPAGDASKKSSSHTARPCERRQNAPQMLAGKPQPSVDLTGKRLSKLFVFSRCSNTS